jgi:hypothetical protein
MQKIVDDVKRLLEEADPTIKVVDASELDQEANSSLPEIPRSQEEPNVDVQAQSDAVSSKLPTTD